MNPFYPLMLIGSLLLFNACGGGDRVSAAAPHAPSSVPPTPKEAPVGFDISYPQCSDVDKGDLPKHVGLAIVGVNGMLANQPNPCLKQELQWAEANAPAGEVSVYVNTANPGPIEGVTDWPTDGNKNPYGTCEGGDTEACAYQYGENLAANDVTDLESTGVPFNGMMYLDAETDYSWQNPTSNRAALEGMTKTFQAHGYKKVGIYSSVSEWQVIAGTVPPDSPLYKLPTWVLGATNIPDAKRACQGSSFTEGPLVLAQAAASPAVGPFDEDMLCGAAQI